MVTAQLKEMGDFLWSFFFLPQSKFKKNPKIKNRSSKVNLKNK